MATLLALGLPAGGAEARGGPRAACLEATRAAERAHDLPRGLMVAIALAESGMHAHALNIGGRSHYPADRETARQLLLNAPRGASIMAGCVQVNANVHARGADWPLDPARSADWGARLLRTHYNRTGNWEEAIRRWNGGSPAVRQNLLCRVQAKLLVVNPESNVLDGVSCGRSHIARVRRDGVMLLAQAEEGR